VVRARYRWPTHAVGDARRCTARATTDIAATVTTTYELRTGEPFVRVRHDIENPVRDHRLRAHHPLPEPVTTSDAECAYAVVTRGLTAEGGPHEPGLPTWPSRRFVDASDGTVGLAVVHDGLLEHEVVAGGTELAITLLRAVGYLSRIEPDLRPNPAGPALAVPGAQLLGEQTATYALVPHRGRWSDAALHDVATRVLTPLPVATVTTGFATRPRHGTAGPMIEIDRSEVAAFRRRVDGDLEVRIFNPHLDPTTTTLPDGAVRVDLVGRPIADRAPIGDEGRLTLGRGEVATVHRSGAPVTNAWRPPRPASSAGGSGAASGPKR
jgi:alpha-mannosidase